MRKEFKMKKWIITGAIIGIGNPIISIPTLSYLIDLTGGSFSVWGCRLETIGTIVFPFGFLTMDINPDYTPYFFWSIYILALILNVGLYAFLGYIVGSIAQTIKRT